MATMLENYSSANANPPMNTELYFHRPPVTYIKHTQPNAHVPAPLMKSQPFTHFPRRGKLTLMPLQCAYLKFWPFDCIIDTNSKVKLIYFSRSDEFVMWTSLSASTWRCAGEMWGTASTYPPFIHSYSLFLALTHPSIKILLFCWRKVASGSHFSIYDPLAYDIVLYISLHLKKADRFVIVIRHY